MDNDAVFQYTKLIIENFWILIIAAAVIALARNPRFLDRISSFKIADIEVVLREIKLELEDTKATVKELTAVNEEYRSELDSMDINGALGPTRQAVKAMAGSATDADVLAMRRGFAGDATPEDVFGAAVMARTRKDPALFDDVIACLSTIADDKDLRGLRLNIVWTLASAAHLTLVAVQEHRKAGILSEPQLLRAKAVLERLVAHQKVRNDRPDNPSRGIQGPARQALKRIDAGLKAIAAGRQTVER